MGPAGWLTDALGLKATSPTPSLQLLIIPGNPGLGSFYTRFIEELHALFQGTADVWAVSNLGHDAENLCEGRVWCLDTQIAHKAQLLKEHVLAPGKPPAVVLAHSIGSYMALQVRWGRSRCLGLVDAPLSAVRMGVQRLHEAGQWSRHGLCCPAKEGPASQAAD